MARQLAAMGFYPDDHLRHSHRAPAEIAEDEKIAALRGGFCRLLEPSDTDLSALPDPCLVPRSRALVPWMEGPRIRRPP